MPEKQIKMVHKPPNIKENKQTKNQLLQIAEQISMNILSLYCTFYSNTLEPQTKEIPHSSGNPSTLAAVWVTKHATL